MRTVETSPRRRRRRLLLLLLLLRRQCVRLDSRMLSFKRCSACSEAGPTQGGVSQRRGSARPWPATRSPFRSLPSRRLLRLRAPADPSTSQTSRV
ncbi:hypothetical protein T484DRAFT_1937422 [Baffinella frigidus]|nr:hypothetical protein T484DRAFT_1937422 [Cryptophyta sp. CCMP2293]